MVEVGGVATRAELVRRTSRGEVDRALRERDVVASRHGRYRLPEADAAVAAAHRLSGVLALSSAALQHGLEVKHVSERPHVVVPRGRRLPLSSAAGVCLHRRNLHPSEVDGVATDLPTTLEMCLRLLPFDEGLAVADFFLRHGGARTVLRGIAQSARGHGAAKVRRVAAAASGDAANPFESVLRAIALAVTGLHVEPQQVVRSPIV